MNFCENSLIERAFLQATLCLKPAIFCGLFIRIFRFPTIFTDLISNCCYVLRPLEYIQNVFNLAMNLKNIVFPRENKPETFILMFLPNEFLK